MAFQSYAAFKGSKQGQIRGGGCKDPKRDDKWVELAAFNMNSTIPVDPTGGAIPAGRRRHSPITITKEFGAASPQLLDAHWAAEVFSEVVIEVVARPDTGGSGGGEKVIQRITLTNATIADVRCYVGPLLHSGTHNGRTLSNFTFECEEIQYAFQMIDVGPVYNKKANSDGW